MTDDCCTRQANQCKGSARWVLNLHIASANLQVSSTPEDDSLSVEEEVSPEADGSTSQVVLGQSMLCIYSLVQLNVTKPIGYRYRLTSHPYQRPQLMTQGKSSPPLPAVVCATSAATPTAGVAPNA